MNVKSKVSDMERADGSLAQGEVNFLNPAAAHLDQSFTVQRSLLE